jgi:type I restriction enzyme, R subunit
VTTGFITEEVVEQGTLNLLRDSLGYTIASGPEIAPDGIAPERLSYQQVVLNGRLRAALTRINPQLPPEAIDQVIRRVTAPETPQLLENNRIFHRYLTSGVAIEYRDKDETRHGLAWLVDFDIQRTMTGWRSISSRCNKTTSTVALTLSSSLTACPPPLSN